MSNITVIIPVHKYDEEISNYLTTAIKSVQLQKNIDEIPEIIIVYPPEIEEKIKLHNIEDLKINFLKNNGITDYQSQVNLGVKNTNTKYFSVLEFDDEYSISYFKNIKEYTEAYPDIDIILTLLIEVDGDNNGLKYTNEVVWAQQFIGENGEMGYLNQDTIKQYSDFKLSGAVIKKKEFNNVGEYKSNIKFSFMYEFLLRALNSGLKIFSMPKIGYKHLANREDSLSVSFLNSMSVNERKFWFETAQKEANFITDRIIDTSLIIK